MIRFTIRYIKNEEFNGECYDHYGVYKDPQNNLFIATDTMSEDGNGYLAAIVKFTPLKRQMIKELVEVADKTPPIQGKKAGFFLQDGEMVEQIALFTDKDADDLFGESFDDIEKHFVFAVDETEAYDNDFVWKYTPGRRYIDLEIRQIYIDILTISIVSIPLILLED